MLKKGNKKKKVKRVFFILQYVIEEHFKIGKFHFKNC